MSSITTDRSAGQPGTAAGYGAAPGRSLTSRAWAFTGLAAGVTGLAGVIFSMSMGAVYDEEISGNAVKIADQMGDQVPQLLAFHTAFTICTVLLIVFAAGLHRRLAAQAPAGSLLPGVAAGGIGLTAVATFMGTGLDTEFLFSPPADETVAESAVFFGHWVATIPWLWLGAGIAALAVAVAALRHAAAPRWLGWVSLVLGGLTTLVGISPLQYMAGFVGPVWLVVAGLAFAFCDRASRARVSA